MSTESPADRSSAGDSSYAGDLPPAAPTSTVVPPPDSTSPTPAPKAETPPLPPPQPEPAPQPPQPSESSDSKKPLSNSSDSDFITIPSYSKWFSWNNIHECEVRLMPEFFDGRSPSKNPSTYKYYRNAIINQYRADPTQKITFTEVRRSIVGDVGSIRRVFDFLETWGLINYSPSGKQAQKSDDKDGAKSGAASTPQPGDAAANAVESGASSGDASKKWCSGCKSPCSIACFVCDKYDLVLCARCYVRGNYRVGVSSTEFRRVEISEPVKTDWTDKETLHLLEAVMHYSDNWVRVAEHVGGRTEKECVARFIKLPFGEQFVGSADPGEDNNILNQMKDEDNVESGDNSPTKRIRLTPLADASNPIMAQAAFLSALAGVEVAENAAKAAVTALYKTVNVANGGSVHTHHSAAREQAPGNTANGDAKTHALESHADTESLLRQEEDQLENAISNIAEVQVKEIQEKIKRFEEMDMQLEKERKQWHQMKHQLFIDQVSLLLHKLSSQKSGENIVEENVRTQISPLG